MALKYPPVGRIWLLSQVYSRSGRTERSGMRRLSRPRKGKWQQMLGSKTSPEKCETEVRSDDASSVHPSPADINHRAPRRCKWHPRRLVAGQSVPMTRGRQGESWGRTPFRVKYGIKGLLTQDMDIGLQVITTSSPWCSFRLYLLTRTHRKYPSLP